MSFRYLAWVAFLPLAIAFRDTVPVVIWSSHSSGTLDSLSTHPTPFTHNSGLYDILLEGDHLCQYDAVIIAEQPGLHASDLRTVSQSSYLFTTVNTAASSLQIPYLPYVEGDSLDEFKRTLAERCNARRVELRLGQGGVNLHNGEKHMVCVSMPHLEGESAERKDAMRAHEGQLSSDISRVASIFPTHLVIYAGSRPFTKRQDADHADIPSRPIIEPGSEFASDFAPVNSTLAEGSLFQRYRFFTPGLITALLVVFGLLIPILMVGIYALASIQSPIRMDAPRGPSLEKKNQ